MAERVLALALVFVGALLTACEDPPPDPSADVAVLRTLMNSDPVDEPFGRAVEVAGRRPVDAAGIVEQEVLPPAHRQLEAARGVTVVSPTVTPIHGRLLQAYEDRIGALERYQRALAGGTQTRDEDLFEAMNAVSDIDMRLLRIHEELDAFPAAE